MSSLDNQKIYCSLDIETTGFDPLVEEVLEVGWVFFSMDKNGINTQEEWTQVFKPIKEVSPKILGLTGITKEEISSAPDFSEFRDFIQKKLQDAVIVGHNVVFDIKFLELKGIKFSGQIVDTLDLAQWLLPTHHGYNLESLMHYFRIPHEEAHRALMDAMASIKMLESLLAVFGAFDKALKENLIKFINQGGFEWADLFSQKINKSVKLTDVQQASEFVHNHRVCFCKEIEFKDRQIVNFSAGINFLPCLLETFKKSKIQHALIVPSKQMALKLWRLGLAEVVCGEEDLFDGNKFKAFLQKPELTGDELKFALKILVWQKTNWQNKSLADLNLSFFGGQFKSLVCGKPAEANVKNKIVCAEIKTFLELLPKEIFSGRLATVFGLNVFEQAVSQNLSKKISAGYINYQIKTVYNPEVGAGNKEMKDAVLQALSDSDLFFGLTAAMLQKGLARTQQVEVTPEFINSQEYLKIKSAAENFAEKLQKFSKELSLSSLADSAERLLDFFKETPNTVKWIEISEKYCAFNSAPIDITQLVLSHINLCDKLIFVDALGESQILKYFISRLGLKSFRVKQFSQKAQKGQGVLFKIKNRKIKSQKKPNCYINQRGFGQKDLESLVVPEALPGALLLASPMEVRQYYEQNFQHLQTFAFLHTQNHSGGVNKLINNFSIHQDSLLLATAKFLLKSLPPQAVFDADSRLRVKRLILCQLPFEQFTHPYQKAVSQLFKNPFEEYSLPRAVYNFHTLLQFFNTSLLEEIYLFDVKLKNSYANKFIEYLKNWVNLP